MNDLLIKKYSCTYPKPIKSTFLKIFLFFQKRYLESPVKGLLTITENIVYCVKYRDPKYPRGFVFPARRLKGAKEPLRVLKPQDFEERGGQNWRPIIGMAPSTTR